jgi:hypothetical protein
MKDAEDEAFDELAKRQGHWGGGYQAKKAMAADKFQENVPLYASKTAFGGWREFASDYERGFIDGMQKQAQSSVDKAVNQMAQPTQEPVAVHQFRLMYSADWYDGHPDSEDGHGPYETRTLYTTPPQREWVGLTEKEAKSFISFYKMDIARLVEAKLKEKNNGT